MYIAISRHPATSHAAIPVSGRANYSFSFDTSIAWTMCATTMTTLVRTER